MSNPVFIQAGLAEFPEYVYVVAPDASEKFKSIPLIRDAEYRCVLIEPQANAFQICLSKVVNDEYLSQYLDRIRFCCFAVAPDFRVAEMEFRMIDEVDYQAAIEGSDNDWEHESNYRYTVAGVPLNTIFSDVEAVGNYVDCLALDIQGIESEVLKSLTCYPRVVIVEIHSPENEVFIREWADSHNYHCHGDVGEPEERPNLLFERKP